MYFIVFQEDDHFFTKQAMRPRSSTCPETPSWKRSKHHPRIRKHSYHRPPTPPPFSPSSPIHGFYLSGADNLPPPVKDNKLVVHEKQQAMHDKQLSMVKEDSFDPTSPKTEDCFDLVSSNKEDSFDPMLKYKEENFDSIVPSKEESQELDVQFAYCCE